MFALFMSSFLIGCGEEAPKQQTFDNLPPFSPIISLTPTEPYTSDDLVVGIITESTDPDGDDVTTGYVWTVDGVISDEASETIPASSTAKGEVWTVNVISNDGSLDSAPATFSVTIKNTAPVIDGITESDSPDAGDAISVTVDGVTDPDGDDVELSYSWTVNGEGSSIDSGEVPADTTLVNDVWVLTITPNDGDTDGEAVTATFDYSNAVPVISEVTISPDPTSTADELSANVAVTDDEGDTIEGYTYEWFVNGESAGTDATLAAATAVRDDVVSVTVVASDAYGSSDPVSSVDVTIGNAAPSIDGLTVTPDPATTSDALTAAATTSDADSDTVTTTYEWFVNTVTAGNTDTLDASLFVKGDEVTVTATATDATDTTTLTSSALVISNTAPTASVAIDQTSAVTTDTLTATATTDDADQDVLTPVYDWMVDSVSTGITTNSLDASYFSKGQSVTVSVTVDDGSGAVSATSAALVIDNSVPTASIAIDQTSAFTTDTLSATYSSDDADFDSLTPVLDWMVDNVSTGVTTNTLDPSNFTKGQSVTVSVTVDDGSGAVTETSAALVISNSIPTAGTTIGPNAAVYGEDVDCGLLGESDNDTGDVVTISEIVYTFDNGATETTAGTPLALTVTDHGAYTSVACTPTLTDGEDTVVGVQSNYVSITDLALRHLVVGDLVITEIMNNPSAPNDADSEWFEVWVNTVVDTTTIGGGNRGDVNLRGLTISDDGTDFDQKNLDVIVSVGDYIVFGENDDTSVNGDVDIDYVFTGALSNGSDEIYIWDVESATVFDGVLWDDGITYPDTNGASMNLPPTQYDSFANDNGAFWCDSTSTFGDGDFGTPGLDNDTCP